MSKKPRKVVRMRKNKGIRCPQCYCKDLRAWMTRTVEGGTAVRRVKKCRSCGHTIETIERQV